MAVGVRRRLRRVRRLPGAHLDLDFRHSGNLPHGTRGHAVHDGLGRRRLGSEGEGEGDLRVGDGQVANEPERNDVLLRLRILHRPQRIQHGVLSDHTGDYTGARNAFNVIGVCSPYLCAEPCILATDLLQKAGDLSGRIPPYVEPFRLRRDGHHGVRSRRPADGAHRERLYVRVARAAAHPRVRGPQGAELSGAGRQRDVRRQHPVPRPGARVAPVRDDEDREQVRGRGVHAEPARPAAPRRRAGPAGVRNRQRPSRRRPLDLRRTRRARVGGRRVAAGLLSRPLRPSVRGDSVTFIPLSRPPVDDEIKRAVLAAIDSRQYVLGPQCRQLEVELASTTGVKHAVLTSSATAALWLALRALGVKAGDEILVPSHTAFPTVEAICFAEATPVFVDADEFYTLDAPDAEAKATPRTVGVVPVHLYGQPVDLTAVARLASRLGLWILEDCAQAQGAEWNGQRVGSFGRAAVFSFYPSKNLPGR